MKLLFVTSNTHKYEEIKQYLAGEHIECRWKKMKYEEIQAETTDEVSMESLKILMNDIREPFFLEDTGLYIDALNGFPGPYSSYVFKTVGNEGILHLLHGKERGAAFVTVVSYYDGKNYFQFKGECRGAISKNIRGNTGFGYDPIFIPEGYDMTYAEMTIEEKNRTSHRIRAMEKFVAHLKSQK